MVMTMTMMTMMVMVIRLKRCWVPEGIYFWLQKKWENICQSGKKRKGWRRIFSHEE